jgi:FAD/FMN-containing dehydrogenase
MFSQPSHTAVDELRFRLSGGLHEPGDPAYEETCTLYNSMIDRRPRWVAKCAAPDDVIAALAFARAHGIEVAVRAGGHSVAGMSLTDGGLVIDLRLMNDVQVAPKRRVARVGGGAVGAELDRATTAHGLAVTGGRVSTTGVAGLTLGGGTGWLERKHGFACDNLIGAELVTADGELVRTDEHENTELLWALRGGGGNFGVVTAFEFRLHPIPEQVLAGLVVYPGERGRDVLRFFRDYMRSAPEEVSIGFAYFTAPDEPEIPAELRGRQAVLLAGMYAGPVAEGEAALAPVREFGPPAADLFEPMGYADFQSSLDDPPGYRNYWTAEHLTDLTDEAIELIAARSEQVPAGPSQIFIPAWGGAVARATDADSPLGSIRDAAFVVHPLLLWEDPADDEAMFALGRGYRDDLREHSTGAVYLNYIGEEGGDRVRAGYGDSHVRLARIKADWDPDNVFHRNQNVRPAEEEIAQAA